MLFFFDETARRARSGHRLEALCGVAIDEEQFASISSDVYSMKRNSIGRQFADNRELKGTIIFKEKNFRERDRPEAGAMLAFALDLCRYLSQKSLRAFGIVRFGTNLGFRCHDPQSLDGTHRALLERIEAFMQRERKGRRAKIVFDDVEHGFNAARAEAITNFFNRYVPGQAIQTIIVRRSLPFHRRRTWAFNWPIS